ncbi:LLM class flavin-dependent oxidoreductase [Myceligenerans crystallogenes]|uniref:LLM class F420-dependent oxidoreductase n=1 Tax=Myceligenerans crystallogenes TaxID=316335 RepID=A0ABN2NCB4_9MICO
MTTYGLALPHYDGLFPDASTWGARRTQATLAYARRAEDLGFAEVWVSDHLTLTLDGGPRRRSPDCWTLLGAIAQRTDSIRLGSLVSNASLRPPALLAHQVATVIDLAGTRVDVGLGAGWNAQEYVSAGIAFPDAGERLAAVQRTADAVRQAAGEATPPLWIGGKRSGALAMAGKIGDGWNLAWDPNPAAFDTRRAQVNAAAEAAGRPAPRVSVGLTTLVGQDEPDLRRRWELLRRRVPDGYLDRVTFDQWRTKGLIGTVDDLSARARTWTDRDVDHIICAFGMPFALFDDDQLNLTRQALSIRRSSEQEPTAL